MWFFARALIPFRGPQGQFPYVSATDVLAGTADPDLIRDRLVIIGSTATGILDLRSGHDSDAKMLSAVVVSEDGKHSFAKFTTLVPAPEGGKRTTGLCPKDAPVLPSGSSRVPVPRMMMSPKAKRSAGEAWKLPLSATSFWKGSALELAVE